MRSQLFAVTARVVLSSLLMVVLATPAMGLDRAPQAKESGGWLSVLALIVLGIGLCVGSFLSPRRSHLD
ncbi:MAG: hypothetical protein ACIAXF_14550 [Phycisphaerales bacterium JB063]